MGLHFAATEGPNAMVVFTAPTFKQVQRILWRELRLLVASAKTPIGVNLAKVAATGMEFADGSQILGMVAKDPDSFQGLRAPKMRIIADEASGIDDDMFVALEGNLAGGGDLLLTGNPTRDEGYFFDSFSGKLDFDVVRLSSIDSPNVRAGKIVVPGIATREWVEARKRQWGEDSPLYRVHVLGQAANLQGSRLYPDALVEAATRRWEGMTPTGRIVIGVDPAGKTGLGDETAFAPRRGHKVLWVRRRRGLSEDGHVVEINGMIRDIRHHPPNKLDLRLQNEKALVVIDRDGDVGAKVYSALVAEAERSGATFEVRGIRGSDKSRRHPREIALVRDELAINLVERLNELGIPSDGKLQEEMAKIRIVEMENGKAKIVSKKVLRKELGRSPDSFDALTLSVYYDDEPGEIDVPMAVSADGDDGPWTDQSPYDGPLSPYGGV